MDSTMNTSLMLMMMNLLVPLVGFMMAITPYLMKKSECFTVTVPETALADPYLKGLKKRFFIEVVLVSALLFTLGFFASFMGNEMVAIILFTVSVLFVVAFGYGLMLRNRSKVRLYKAEQQWTASHEEAVAVVDGGAAPKAISLRWNLLYIPVIVLTLLISVMGYPAMPDQVPMQVGFDGEATRYAAKSLSIVLMPLLVQAFMALCFFGAHWMILRSKRLLDPQAPATSSFAYGMFAHAQSVYLVALGMIFCISMIMLPLSFMGVVTLMQAAVFIMVCSVIAVIGGLAIAVVYGQGGSRVFARMQSSDKIPTDEDRFWKLGIFYVNKDDPSLFLLERFGVGWTFNFGRPAVWVIIALFIVITVGFVAIISLLS
ncbi:MAG: DUF1648 domain-containing protein [Coriobacteriia bacterium]|nr:DUF1648 domain-containing protein [Coriobacteriia bacterium]